MNLINKKKTPLYQNLSFLLTALSCLLITKNSEASQVTQTKNNKVMIDTQGDEMSVDQEFYLVTPDNKKIALVKITAVKGGKAIASILKGKSNGNETLELKGGVVSANRISQDADSVPSKNDSILLKPKAKKISLLLSLFNNSMTAKESDGGVPVQIQNVSMTGTSFGLTGVYEQNYNSWLTLRGTAGYEPFKASGTATINGCDSTTSTSCNADISYLSAGAYARFELYKMKNIFYWGALGGTFKFPIAKTSTALKTDDLKLTATYAVALGLDYYMSSKYFISVSIEQQTFMSSDTVSANFLAIRFGIGKPF